MQHLPLERRFSDFMRRVPLQKQYLRRQNASLRTDGVNTAEALGSKLFRFERNYAAAFDRGSGVSPLKGSCLWNAERGVENLQAIKQNSLKFGGIWLFPKSHP